MQNKQKQKSTLLIIIVIHGANGCGETKINTVNVFPTPFSFIYNHHFKPLYKYFHEKIAKQFHKPLAWLIATRLHADLKANVSRNMYKEKIMQ